MFSKLVITLFVCLCVQAQQWKNEDEYNLFQSIVQSIRGGDYMATLAGLDKWKAQFPESVFAETRLELYVVTYTQLKRSREVIDTSKEILAKFPDKQIALAAIAGSVYEFPKSAADLDAAEQAANRLIDRAGIVYSKENRPPDMTDESAEKAKTAIQPFAHRTLGWIALQRGEYEKAVPELIKTLELDANDVKASMLLGQAYAQQKKIELRPLVIFHYTRAATHETPGAFGDADRKSMLGYAESQYNGYTGSSDGFDRVLATAKAQALPAPDFHIASAQEIAEQQAQAQRERDAQNPMLALWRQLRIALTRDNGEDYFNTNVKDALLPAGVNGVKQFRGKLVEGRAKNRELLIAIENPAGDAILQLDGPVPGTMDPGGEIAFEGVVREFTRDPFTLTFEVDRARLEGWTGKPIPRRKRY